jgi:hypothetical protein
MKTTNYEFITDKIYNLKAIDANLYKGKPNDYIFTALATKSIFFKTPSKTTIFNNELTEGLIVDGANDGGVDALFYDPNSESTDLILFQGKYHENIDYDSIRNAIDKLVHFYNDFEKGNYHQFNNNVKKRMLNLRSEVGDESKITFVIATSAPKNGININRLEKIVEEQYKDQNKYNLKIYFDKDIVEEIKEAESLRDSVETGKLTIDEPDNFLQYDQDKIFNISAFSLKELYSKEGLNLLSKNLRYYLKKKDIDKGIASTIANEKNRFWHKNNGLTIICDNYRSDGRIIHLNNFSIINGGQTTYLISKNETINKENDFYLTCKIITNKGNTNKEKDDFVLNIAQATNSQKPIKEIDLRANSPEQVRFGKELIENDIFYQTKRGESVRKGYELDYKNTNLMDVGKLSLAGLFQKPGTSRNQPSVLFDSSFYNPIFTDENIRVIAGQIKDLLYVDYYFRKKFLKVFEKNNETFNSEMIPFANNARTLCIAYIAFSSRFINSEINEDHIKVIKSKFKEEKAYENNFYEIFKPNPRTKKRLLSTSLFDGNKDALDDLLYKSFETIIKQSYRIYQLTNVTSIEKTNETNFLKNDKNYYLVLANSWDDIHQNILNSKSLYYSS